MQKMQSGRSMVEMLGVLAIIGVLSVGGIAGYSKAMFKHKFTKTIDIISYAVNRLTELDNSNLTGFSLTTSQQAHDYDVIPDCDVNSTDGSKCLLPLGEISFMIDNNYSHGNNIAGVINISFLQNPHESCIAFWNSEIYKIVPDSWWNYGVVAVTGADIIYAKSEHKNLQADTKSEFTATDIVKACEPCLNANNCTIEWIMGMKV
ncbi:MAG: type II secretion system protein [Alphaproteobacteria bacterium]|nr:type II secretion system protein [Alphaproteobacteria bacterium]